MARKRRSNHKSPEESKRDAQRRNEKYYRSTEKGKLAKRRNVLRKYGLTLEEYQNKWNSQQGVCAVCKQPETRIIHGVTSMLAVDHCHKTNKVRDLLCDRCNRALGTVDDNLDLLHSLTSYLENHLGA